jgi:hypothetical protein
MKILSESFAFFSSQLNKGNENVELEKLAREIDEEDVRIFLYLKTIAHLNEQKQVMNIFSSR